MDQVERVRGIFSLFDISYPDVQQTCFSIPQKQQIVGMYHMISMY